MVVILNSFKDTWLIMSLLFIGYRAIFSPEVELFHFGPVEVLMFFAAGIVFFLSILLHGRTD